MVKKTEKQTEQRSCSWADRSPEEQVYHDTEWGTPIWDDQKMFEFLILENMQAGLSWTLILKRREAMRKAFDGFDLQTVAAYDESKEQELLKNPDIIRNRLKIKALARNANAFIEVQKEFGSFQAYIWSFTDGKTVTGHWQTEGEVPAASDLSDRVSKAMKKRGFTFVGSTIIYSFLQAIGIVNDHITTCPRYKELMDKEH